MDEAACKAAVNSVIRRWAKWIRSPLEVGDLRGEAWLAALEAARRGADDPMELQRVALNAVHTAIRRAEADSRRLVAVGWDEDEQDD